MISATEEGADNKRQPTIVSARLEPMNDAHICRYPAPDEPNLLVVNGVIRPEHFKYRIEVPYFYSCC